MIALFVAFIMLMFARGALAEGFGVEKWDGAITAGEAGGPFTQAGGHPYEIETTIGFNTEGGRNGAIVPVSATKDVLVELPPGLVGNPTALTQCTAQQLFDPAHPGRPACPNASQVGFIYVNAVGEPLYNMVPPSGVPARFGFKYIDATVVLDGAVRGEGSLFHLGVDSKSISQAVAITEARVVFWGVPADPSHDGDRCPASQVTGFQGQSPHLCAGVPGSLEGPHEAGVPPVAFLTLPTSCTALGEGLRFEASIDSWLEPGVINPDDSPDLAAPGWQTASFSTHEPAPNDGVQRGTEGCDRVPSEPVMTVQPTVKSAESPSGLDVKLQVPAEGLLNPTGIAQADLKTVSVTLPEGLTINPSAGEGLGYCTPAQYASETAFSEPGSGCPDDSKLGTVEVDTPVLPNPLEGSIYIAQEYDNPFGSLIALYIVAKDPGTGVIVKTAGKVEPNPVTGQLTTTFENLPQAPFSDFKFDFREGQRSPLSTPPLCGSYTTHASFTPWANPASSVSSDSSFEIAQGIAGGACPPGGTPPFTPGVVGGTINNNAGSYSPVYVHLTRRDGEQEISSFSTTLPAGLTGNLSGIPFCPEASIALARTKTGFQEAQEPSCPAGSLIGHTLVGTGVGSALSYVPGKVYLAGPFDGAPFSVVSITSATVGPFDLGTVVIRFGLQINPYTAQVSVTPSSSEPIPHIIKGIVTHVRDIRVYIDRSNFTLNPTNCDSSTLSSTLNSDLGQTATIQAPFQAANCSALMFKPKFTVSTSGKTSRASGASLTVKLTYPSTPQGTEANIARVKVELPKQLPSRLTTLQKACAATQFETNPAGCPAASIIGHAKATTPILPVPLEGPAYFVSHGGEAFPSLIVVLQGYGVTVDLVGSTFISKAGITSSTFKTVPDVPVATFELTLPQGPYSALTTSNHLCASKLTMPTEFIAQNGATIHQPTPITTTGCKPTKTKKTNAKKTKKKTTKTAKNTKQPTKPTSKTHTAKKRP